MVALELTKHLTLSPPNEQGIATVCGPYNDILSLIDRTLGIEINNRDHDFDIFAYSACNFLWFQKYFIPIKTCALVALNQDFLLNMIVM